MPGVVTGHEGAGGTFEMLAQGGGVVVPRAGAWVRNDLRGSVLEEGDGVFGDLSGPRPDHGSGRRAAGGGDERGHLERPWTGRVVEAPNPEPGIDLGRLEGPQPVRQRPPIVERDERVHPPPGGLSRASRGTPGKLA